MQNSCYHAVANRDPNEQINKQMRHRVIAIQVSHMETVNH